MDTDEHGILRMSWEAFRLTSKSPSEVLHVLGPHGVDDLIIKMRDAVWREYPEDRRTFENVKKRVAEVFSRNMKVWSAIKKPAPAAFFENLLPYAADGHMRQALVLAWMMMPRAGGRDFKDVKKIVTDIYERNIAAWEQDHRTFTAPVKKRAAPKKVVRKSAVKKKNAQKTSKKRGKK
jgi:hypothetical protein